MFIGCRHLRDLLGAQKEIIERHIDRHKWFRYIEDREEAIADFVDKFGWIMREFHCTQICPDRQECEYPHRLEGEGRLPYAPPQHRQEWLSPMREQLLRCVEAGQGEPRPAASWVVSCQHLDTLLESQSGIIQRHLERHKWFRHIKTPEEAIADFVREFGWVMRELYCGLICADRSACGVQPSKP